jgi:DNA-directed RNA polymerase specialized sigma24 family protein
MTDAQLVSRAQAGDLPAFEELVQKYQREVYGLACRMVSDVEEAKDLAQQAFLQAFVHIRSFRQDAQFRTWLFRIAINQCYNFLKSRKKFGDPLDWRGPNPPRRPIWWPRTSAAVSMRPWNVSRPSSGP